MSLLWAAKECLLLSFMCIVSNNAARLSHCPPSSSPPPSLSTPLSHFYALCPQLCPGKAVCLAWPNEVEGEVIFSADHFHGFNWGRVTQNGEEESGDGNQQKDVMGRWCLSKQAGLFPPPRDLWADIRARQPDQKPLRICVSGETQHSGLVWLLLMWRLTFLAEVKWYKNKSVLLTFALFDK